MNERERLLELLRRDALQRGDFVLSSGARSTYYVDCRMVTLSPEGAYLVGKIIAGMLANDDVQAVGGLTMGADPIATAVSLAAYAAGCEVRAFLVRKEAKKHGGQRLIEGPFHAGDRAVVLEDVVTTADSTFKAIEAVQEAGGTVARVIALLDRQQGGAERLRDAGHRFDALFTKDDLLAE